MKRPLVYAALGALVALAVQDLSKPARTPSLRDLFNLP